MGKHIPNKAAKQDTKTAATTRRAQINPITPTPAARSGAAGQRRPQARPRPGPTRRTRRTAEIHPDGSATMKRVAPSDTARRGEHGTNDQNNVQQQGVSQTQQIVSQSTTAAVLDLLRNGPYLPVLRQIVQQHPAMLNPTVQILTTTSPALFVHITQAQFIRLLTEPLTPVRQRG